MAGSRLRSHRAGRAQPVDQRLELLEAQWLRERRVHADLEAPEPVIERDGGRERDDGGLVSALPQQLLIEMINLKQDFRGVG